MYYYYNLPTGDRYSSGVYPRAVSLISMAKKVASLVPPAADGIRQEARRTAGSEGEQMTGQEAEQEIEQETEQEKGQKEEEGGQESGYGLEWDSELAKELFEAISPAVATCDGNIRRPGLTRSYYPSILLFLYHLHHKHYYPHHDHHDNHHDREFPPPPLACQHNHRHHNTLPHF
jgi:hypothetical protein